MFGTVGIDIGTTFITTYDRQADAVSRIRHNGKINETLQQLLEPIDADDRLVFTGKGGGEIAEAIKAAYIEEAVAVSYLLAGDHPFGGEEGRIIDIGASSLTLYTVTGSKVTDIAENTLCAAGTGLFLEEQAERLNIDLERFGELSVIDPPLIASRCTVFAKSDLIHHQQEGRGKDEMWSGLCRSLALSAANTLFRGQELKGNILICGGVSMNKEVVKWFKHLYPGVNWIIPGYSEALAAVGASEAEGTPKNELDTDACRTPKTFDRMPPLTLNRSRYPHMIEPVTDDFDNEIRIHTPGGRLPEPISAVILGMDIGSTSTKLAVLDAATREPLLDIYGRTAGDPVQAARNIFASYYRLLHGRDIPVQAFGTTGSGRYLVGKIFGADHIVNEISAHARGTTHFFPDVETIFEIGGQDAKYIHLKDGYAADVNMNYVCAAGTGSFVEEQARKLGFRVEEVGDITAGIAPPVTSDRCTVFMEQDLRMLLKEGFSKEEALASVLYSVIRNYLARVKGNRPVTGGKLFFQGATARNRGLTAALENLLDMEIMVSPFCHLMGGIGAALIAREFSLSKQPEDRRHPLPQSRFVGREAITLQVASRSGTCKLCRNVCRINYVSRDNGPEFSWGYQCGRDPEEITRKEIDHYRLFNQREQAFRRDINEDQPGGIRGEAVKGVVTIVNALTNFTFYPLWKRFFNELGYRVQLSGRTGPAVKKHASAMASADFCFPVKVALGHVVKGLREPGPLFLPYMIADKPAMKTAHSFFCPYMQSCASFVRSTLSRGGIDADDLLAPVIDLRKPVKHIVDRLYDTLKTTLAVDKKEVAAAFKSAGDTWEKLTADLERTGTEVLEQSANTGEPVFVLVGRSYNLHDRGINLGIPETIASRGFTVIPIDMLSLDTASLAEGNYHNVFWKYGQRILAAMQTINRAPNIFPIYLTNFNCGPDSFLLGFAEEESKGKPMLILELDEHDSDGGYLTRVEAFLDVVHAYMKKQPLPAGDKLPHKFTSRRRPDLEGAVWFPAMHTLGHHLMIAAFRAHGYDARSLPMHDMESFAMGKKHLRGGECLPMTLTMGAFLNNIKKEDPDRRHILFMPTAEGPCRFGQYNLMDRIVFHNLRMSNVDILSPSSINSYQGLGGKLRRDTVISVICADILFKMLTKTRPYELNQGDARQVYENGIRRMESVIEKQGDLPETLRTIAADFAAIPISKEKKPLVGVVGEIYVRCDPFANGGLIDTIEKSGGEAWLTPMFEWFTYITSMPDASQRNRFFDLLNKGDKRLTYLYFQKVEQTFYRAAGHLLADRHEPPLKDVVHAGTEYLPRAFEGEAVLTIGRAVHFARRGADMVINTAPFGCMPGTLSSSILLEIKEKFDIPFVSLFYDGDIGVNHKVASLLKTITMKKKEREPVPSEPLTEKKYTSV